jgi:hypothetical protein
MSNSQVNLKIETNDGQTSDVLVSQSQISDISLPTDLINPNTNPQEDSNETLLIKNSMPCPTGLVRLYHDNGSDLVLEPYCQPISSTFSQDKKIECKYKNQCVVKRSRLMEQGNLLSEEFTTVYKNNLYLGKFHYDIMDLRFVHCFNTSCKSSNSPLSKCFHYICYKNMMNTREEMNELKYEGGDDKLKKHIADGINIDTLHHLIDDEDDSDIMFPVCGK